MSSYLANLFVILVSLLGTFGWFSTPSLTPYTLQLAAIVLLFYFFAKFVFANNRSLRSAIDAFVFASLTTSLVIATGGLDSPLFFLLYFLLFTISLLLDPKQAITASLILIFFFGRSVHMSPNTDQMIEMITLLFITPIALIFGRRYLNDLEAQGKIKRLDEIISQEETDTLIWLTTKAKPTMISLLDTTSLIISSNLLPFRLQEKLKSLHLDLVALHESAKDLEKDIDEKSEN